MRLAFFPSISVATSSAEVASPHMRRCLPTVQTSPRFTKEAFSRAVVRSKPSSCAVALVRSANMEESSCSSKPVGYTSTPPAVSSASRDVSFSSSHSPVILLRAMFSRLSSTSDSSTTLTSLSVTPKSSRTRSRWWPPITFPVLRFHTMGSTFPKERMDAFSFS